MVCTSGPGWGDEEAAIHDARKAAAQALRDPMLQGFLATVYERAGHWSAAVEQWVALARVKPTEERAATYQLLVMGIQAYREDRLGDAVEALEAAWRTSPGDPNVAHYLAYASKESGNLPRAIVVLRQALDVHPNDQMSGPIRETLERYGLLSK